MRKYYVVETYQRKGPYNIEELKAYGITKDSIIWCFEYDAPKPAGEIPELAEIFVTPPQKEEQKPQEPEKNEIEEPIDSPEKQIDENVPPPPPTPPQDNLPPKTPEHPTPPTPPDSPVSPPEQKAEPEKKINQEKTITPPPPPPPVIKQQEQKKPTEYKQFKTYTSPNYKPTEPMPPTYLVLSIITTLFCCLVLGIIGIIFSSQVKQKYEAGDINGSKSASKTALILNIIAITVGIIAYSSIIIFNNNL